MKSKAVDGLGWYSSITLKGVTCRLHKGRVRSAFPPPCPGDWISLAVRGYKHTVKADPGIPSTCLYGEQEAALFSTSEHLSSRLLLSAPRDCGWGYIRLHWGKQIIGLQSSSQGWGHQNGPTVVMLAASVLDCETQGWLFGLPMVSAWQCRVLVRASTIALNLINNSSDISFLFWFWAIWEKFVNFFHWAYFWKMN